MIFWLCALDTVTGAGTVALVCATCAVLYLALCLIPGRNRKPGAPWVVLAGLAAAEGLCALVWLRLFFPDGNYANPGLGGAAWVLLYPAALLLCGIAASVWNRYRSRRSK